MVAKQDPPSDLLTLYDLGGASKTEHFEISSYQGLIEAAEAMGESEVAAVLKQDLRQEEEMEKKIQMLRKEYEGRALGRREA